MDRLIRTLRRFGPSMPAAAWPEALRAGLGAGVGLLITGIALWWITPTAHLWAEPLLIAPFAASSVLIFAVPTSPLAQPWAVVVGNSAAALCGLGMIRLVPQHLPAAALAVLMAILVTATLRALHPPAGAAAMAVVLAADPAHPTNLAFALHPVLTGSVILVATGLLWNYLTGRPYPAAIPPPAYHLPKSTEKDAR